MGEDALLGGGALRIQPVEGRGVLWHNTLPGGDIDELSIHAGEPLVPLVIPPPALSREGTSGSNYNGSSSGGGSSSGSSSSGSNSGSNSGSSSSGSNNSGSNGPPEKWLFTKWLRAQPFEVDEAAAAQDGF